jgi:hypothetical protein
MKDQLDKKGRPGTNRQGNPRPGGLGKTKGADDRSGQTDRSQRDQLDDRGRQRHLGHGEQAGDQVRPRPLEEGDQNEDLGRPVRVGEDGPNRPSQDSQWEDKTEGTSRP